MTKDALTAETRQRLSHLGCQASDYAGHSYRIGAATAAPSSGLPNINNNNNNMFKQDDHFSYKKLLSIWVLYKNK